MFPWTLTNLLLIEQLSWTLLHFLWQGFVVAGLAALVFSTTRTCSPQARYAWSVGFLIVLAICPFLTFVHLSGQSAPIPIVRAEASLSTKTIPTAKPLEWDDLAVGPTFSGLPRPTDRWDFIHVAIVCTWLMGQTLVGARIWISAFIVWRVRRATVPIGRELRIVSQRIANRLGMKRCPEVTVSDLISNAAAAGLVRRVVLLPAAWLTEMPLEMLEAVIAHEFAHLRRHDLWINLMQRLVEATLFFHPAVWWLSCRVREERELCCDCVAVAATNQRKTYAQVLEHVARSRGAKPGLLATHLGDDRMSLLRRVQFVLGRNSHATSSGWWSVGLLALLVPLSGYFLAASQSNAEEQQQNAVAVTGDVVDDMVNESATEQAIQHDAAPAENHRLPPSDRLTVKNKDVTLTDAETRRLVVKYSGLMHSGRRKDARTLVKEIKGHSQHPIIRLLVEHSDLTECLDPSEIPKIYTMVYNVPDLVLQAGLPAFTTTGRLPPETKIPGFDTLIELVTSTVAPDTWDDVGGAGAIESFPVNLSLVISQTPDIHEQIHDLLEQLRRLKETQVVLETTSLDIPEAVLLRIGLPGKRVAVLTGKETETLLTSVRGDAHARAFTGPIAMLFNGQSVVLNASTKKDTSGESSRYSIQAFVNSEKDEFRASATPLGEDNEPQANNITWQFNNSQTLLVKCDQRSEPLPNGDSQVSQHFILVTGRVLR